MKYEVIEIATGARMSHQSQVKDKTDVMGTTLFSNHDEAADWLKAAGLTRHTHDIRPVE